jgi:ribosomal protein S13
VTNDRNAPVERDINLAEMSREALDALRAQVDSELEARAFERQLRRELESHLDKQAWIDRHHQTRHPRR